MAYYDALVIGAGLAGSILARELAERGGMQVLLLEQRPHVGGNAYDCMDENRILIHQYGPHIFHTNNKRVFDYLSRFTKWREYEHRVVANVHGTLMPVPFNLSSLHMAFGPERGALLEEKLLRAYGPEEKVSILELRQSDDPDLFEVANYIYHNVFLHYTMKQWGTTPEKIDPNTTARVPVFLSRDDRYFQDKYQGMPEQGYTAMFDSILNHKKISTHIGTAAKQRLRLEDGKSYLDNEMFHGPIIYTGAVDELFDCQNGRLPYRTLDFQFEALPQPFYQTHGTVNYTVSEDYTRITEFKHLTGQDAPDRTTIVKEFARAYDGEKGDVPYYPVISPESRSLHDHYCSKALQYSNLYLLGRLAEYQYYNMDAIAERALTLADELLTV